MSKKRAREIIRAVRKSGRIQFKHRGVSCPACKYVFNNGFTDIPNALLEDNKPDDTTDATITVCTRCRRTLVIEDTGLRVLNDIETMLLTQEQRRAIQLMQEIARNYTAAQS